MSLAPQLESYLQGYLAWLRFEKRYSELTAQSYARDLHCLFELLGNKSLASVDATKIRGFVRSLSGKGLGGRSLARVLSAWRGFFNYLIRDCGYTANPCIGVRAPKIDKALPQALSVEQSMRLMEINHDTLAAIRDQAMLELLYTAGIRLAEMVSLEAVALPAALSAGELIVTGKGNKQRVVPLGSFAITALQAWLAVREQLAQPDETALFVGARGLRIAHRVVQLRLKQWGITQGITSSVHPHLLRHSFATQVLQSSGDLRAVQEMLGHASISSTQIYTHLDFQYLSKIYDTAHPRAKRKT
ncbi:MAG: tyrosine recombinase XerC [Sideroxydans sp.]|nr:tyrosine recombinase XerC [Sideroxydans sp.]